MPFSTYLILLHCRFLPPFANIGTLLRSLILSVYSSVTLFPSQGPCDKYPSLGCSSSGTADRPLTPFFSGSSKRLACRCKPSPQPQHSRSPILDNFRARSWSLSCIGAWEASPRPVRPRCTRLQAQAMILMSRTTACSRITSSVAAWVASRQRKGSTVSAPGSSLSTT